MSEVRVDKMKVNQYRVHAGNANVYLTRQELIRLSAAITYRLAEEDERGRATIDLGIHNATTSIKDVTE